MNGPNNPNPTRIERPKTSEKNFVKSALVGICGAIAAIYLVNPTAGFIELLPDNIPLLGNLDEAGATAILLASLAYFGIDLTSFLKSKGQQHPTSPVNPSDSRR